MIFETDNLVQDRDLINYFVITNCTLHVELLKKGFKKPTMNREEINLVVNFAHARLSHESNKTLKPLSDNLFDMFLKREISDSLFHRGTLAFQTTTSMFISSDVYGLCAKQRQNGEVENEQKEIDIWYQKNLQIVVESFPENFIGRVISVQEAVMLHYASRNTPTNAVESPEIRRIPFLPGDYRIKILATILMFSMRPMASQLIQRGSLNAVLFIVDDHPFEYDFFWKNALKIQGMFEMKYKKKLHVFNSVEGMCDKAHGMRFKGAHPVFGFVNKKDLTRLPESCRIRAVWSHRMDTSEKLDQIFKSCDVVFTMAGDGDSVGLPTTTMMKSLVDDSLLTRTPIEITVHRKKTALPFDLYNIEETKMTSSKKTFATIAMYTLREPRYFCFEVNCENLLEPLKKYMQQNYAQHVLTHGEGLLPEWYWEFAENPETLIKYIREICESAPHGCFHCNRCVQDTYHLCYECLALVCDDCLQNYLYEHATEMGFNDEDLQSDECREEIYDSFSDENIHTCFCSLLYELCQKSVLSYHRRRNCTENVLCGEEFFIHTLHNILQKGEKDERVPKILIIFENLKQKDFEVFPDLPKDFDKFLDEFVDRRIWCYEFDTSQFTLDEDEDRSEHTYTKNYKEIHEIFGKKNVQKYVQNMYDKNKYRYWFEKEESFILFVHIDQIEKLKRLDISSITDVLVYVPNEKDIEEIITCVSYGLSNYTCDDGNNASSDEKKPVPITCICNDMEDVRIVDRYV